MASRSRTVALVGSAAVLLGLLGWWLLGESGSHPPQPSGEGDGRTALPADGPSATGSGESAPSRRDDAAPGPRASVLVRIRTATGDAAGAFLTVIAEGEGTAPSSPAVAGEEPGEWRVDGIPAGPSHRALAGAPGFQTRVFPGLVLTAGEDRDLGEVILERALPVTGRVLDPSGKPVAAARVGALPAVSGFAGMDIRTFMEGLFGETPWVGRTLSREDGTFTLESLGEGKWTLVARKEGFAPGRRDDVLLHASGTALPVEILLEPAHELRVTVTDAEDRPVPGAGVAALLGVGGGRFPSAADRVLGSTDGDGMALLAGLPPGRATLAIHTADGRTAIRDAEVPRVTEITVRLGGTSTLRVTVRDGGGQPVEGAAVTAATDAGGRSNTHFLRAATDAGGVVEWSALGTGRIVLLSAEKAGFAPGNAVAGLFFGNRGESLELKEGETLEQVIRLGPGAVVHGTVSRKQDGVPVAGARVTLVAMERLLLGPTRETTADAEGAYRFEDVPEGAALLVASTATGSSPVDVRSIFSRNPGGDAEGTVTVPAGPAEVRRDLAVEEGATVAGRVTGPDGAPVPGAVVSLGGGGGGGMGGLLELPSTSVSLLTGADGTFTLRGVRPAENAVLTAAAEGFLSGVSARFRTASGSSVEGVDVRLSLGGAIEGRITTLDGKPVAGASVRAFGRPGGRIGPDTAPVSPDGRGATGFTGPDGTYRLERLAVGTFTVRVEAEECLQASRGDVAVGEGAATKADFTLEPGRAIAGTVRDPEGRPLQGARLQIRPTRDSPPVPDGTPRSFSAVSDGIGAFRLSSLPEGTWTLTASAAGLPAATLPSIASGTVGVEVRFEKAHAISGRVTGPDGAAVEGATVRAIGEGGGGQASVRSSADGTFTLEGLGAGSYDLVASRAGSDLGEVRVKGVEAGSTGVHLSMPRALTLRGKVIGPGGAAPGRGFLRLTLKGGDGRSVNGRWSDDGDFTVGGLTAGTWVVVARTFGDTVLEGTAEGEAGAGGVEIRLQPR